MKNHMGWSLLAVTFCLNAYAGDGCSKTECAETDMRCKVDRISEVNVNGGFQGKVASASVPKGPFFNLDFLYWQAKEDGLEFAQKEVVRSSGNPFLIDTEVEDLDFKWSPGFEIGLGYIFPRDGWDLSVSWTYFHSKSHRSVTTTDPDINAVHLRPSWLPVVLGGIADHAAAHWTLNYNIAALELGRNFFIGKWLSVRPHTDLKGVWIHQNYKVNYHGGFQFVDTGVFSTLFKNTHMHADNDFSGVGMAFGADTEWFLTKQFSFLANISGTLAYGKFDIHQDLDSGFLNSAGGVVFIVDEEVKSADNFWRLRPSFETELGLQWHKFFHCNRYRVSVAATYSFTYWPLQNELSNPVTVRDSVPIGLNQNNLNSDITQIRQEGALQLQGGKLEFRMDF